jgi:hypothetical protein
MVSTPLYEDFTSSQKGEREVSFLVMILNEYKITSFRFNRLDVYKIELGNLERTI